VAQVLDALLKKVLDCPEDSSTTYTSIFSLPALFAFHYHVAG